MSTVFVKAWFDLDCEWEGLPPTYRIYVNDELFAERTWNYTEHYLSEMLQILAEPGRYEITVRPVGPNLAEFTASNFRVEYGPGEWIKKGRLLEIQDESQRIPA